MRKLIIIFILISNLIARDENTIVIAGPIATASHPIIYMAKNNVLKDIGKKIEFRLWNNPDELRAMILKKEIDFIALPTNVAANLYNKGVELQLLNVSTWNALGLISRDKNLKTIEDFKDQEIVVPFRADMPDIVLQALIKKANLDIKNDFKIKYVATPIDAMQMLILRRADNVLLAEPAISIALRKTGSFPVKLIAPELYRSMDIQKEWARLYKVEAKIPQAGLAILGSSKGKEELIQRVLEEYNKAIKWYISNKKEASEMLVKTLPMLEAQAIVDSIEFVGINSVDIQNCKDELEFFFEVLLQHNPKVIGNKLPDSDFYYKGR